MDDRKHDRQRKALAEGRRAEAAGASVIYIHGRPYIDPAAEPNDHHESPFPWDLWDDDPRAV